MTPLIVVGDADLPTADLAVIFLSPEPQTIATLARRCGVSRREMELALQRLALDGHALVADGRGYRITADADELAAYTASLRGRLISQYQRIRVLRATERRLRGHRQLEMAL